MVSSTHDQLYKFIFDDLEVRGEIVQLHDVYSNIFANKSYPKAIKKNTSSISSYFKFNHSQHKN